MGMESFMDTPVVNGKAYPTVTLDPKPYRFRILNAANDRFMNLSLYKAVDANGALCDAANKNPTPESTGVACTEVALNPDEVAAALEDPTVFPTPVAGTEGPDWIVIGTEGGFLPAPVVVPAHPTTWVNDPTVFNAGNVDQHSLLVAPAERFDVIVDLSQYADRLHRRPGGLPGARPALRLLHRQRRLPRLRRRPVDPARLRAEHPHRDADQGRGHGSGSGVQFRRT
jgi:FtsP/CotA-like multicopper oxidase with cupredoxin domain